MNATAECKKLGWRHPVWDLLRFFLSIKGANRIATWLEQLRNFSTIDVEGAGAFPVNADDVKLFFAYLDQREKDFAEAFALLRVEEEAVSFCKTNSIAVKQVKTKNQDHHQSSAAMVATVSAIANRVCDEIGIKTNTAPQARCVWLHEKGLHVTARNMDGTLPMLANPAIIWEIKEYWGQTSGGSKMSDAVYECNLVGRELREFEERSGISVAHVVFVDGKIQWTARKSDLKRFLDLMNQGLIDYVFVGKEVETSWEPTLRQLIKDKVFKGIPKTKNEK